MPTQPVEDDGSSSVRRRRLRIRSRNLYFLLALFDVFVIMFSLYLHSRTIEDASEVAEAASSLDDQLRWLQLAQQRVVELNGPGNDLFRAESPDDYARLVRRFENAKVNSVSLFRDAADRASGISGLQPVVDAMIEAAEGLFEDFRPMSAHAITQSDRLEILRTAGPKMAEMDERQHEALWKLGSLVTQHSERKNLLLEEHESRLHSTAIYQRSFVAAVIAILVGVLIFGRRLQESDRALEEQRRLLEEERRERLAAIGEMCSSVAHGIRNPLAAICSSVEMSLETPGLDAKTTRRLQETLKEGERLSDRVHGLLDVARMNGSVRERMSLSEVVQQGVRELGPEIQNRGVSLTLDVTNHPLFIVGDPKSLELAVIELLSNAMEHTPSGGTIHVECRIHTASGDAMFAVEDSGPGVPPAVRDRVFDLFFSTKPRGTGIGLASVKRIAQVHGGDVELQTGDAGGARFVVTLPTDVSKGAGSARPIAAAGRRHE